MQMVPATRYTLWLNTASILKIRFFYENDLNEREDVSMSSSLIAQRCCSLCNNTTFSEAGFYRSWSL